MPESEWNKVEAQLLSAQIAQGQLTGYGVVDRVMARVREGGNGR